MEEIQSNMIIKLTQIQKSAIKGI